MHVSLLAINCGAGALFMVLFFGMLLGHQEQNVSTFWAAVNEEAGTRTYMFLMWAASVIAVVPLFANESPIATMGRFTAQALQEGHVLAGALTMACWLTASVTSAMFAFGIAGYFAWSMFREHVLRKPAPLVVG